MKKYFEPQFEEESNIIKNELSICIIDDGINYVNFNIGELLFDIEIDKSIQITNRSVVDSKITHGTICAGIIKKYQPDVKLGSIKILDDNRSSSVDQLIAAIKWCIQNNQRIINMSLGSTYYMDFEKIKNIIDIAVKRGTIFISASSNDGYFTYPAALSNVIGVKADRDLKLVEGEYFYRSISGDGATIVSSSKFILKKHSEEIETELANSFAAPFVTATVCNYILKNPKAELRDLQRYLYVNSKNYISDIKDTKAWINKYHYNFYCNIDWVEKCILIILSEYEKVEYIETYISNESYVNIEKCINLTDESYEFHNTDDVDYDTAIIYISSLNPNEEKINKVINYYASRDKNLVLLNDERYSCCDEVIEQNKNIKIYSSALIKKLNNGIQDSQKFQPSIPIITAISIGNDDHLRLIDSLNKMFRGDKYYSMAISDNPLSILFGIRYVTLLKNKRFGASINTWPLNYIMSKYPADVLNIGIKLSTKELHLMKMITKSLKTDILIVFMEEINQISDAIVRRCYCELIIICKDINYKDITISRAKVFYFYDNDIYLKIYQYIMQLFNSME